MQRTQTAAQPALRQARSVPEDPRAILDGDPRMMFSFDVSRPPSA